jgi:hypothetical protein
MRLEIIDIPCAEYNIDNVDINFIIDYSKFKVDEESMQLPLEHIVEHTISYEYSLRPGGQVHFVVVNDNNNEIKEIFFLANDDINLQILNDDIISFLVELKLY